MSEILSIIKRLSESGRNDYVMLYQGEAFEIQHELDRLTDFNRLLVEVGNKLADGYDRPHDGHYSTCDKCQGYNDLHAPDCPVNWWNHLVKEIREIAHD